MRWQFLVKVIIFLILLSAIPVGLIVFMINTGFQFYGVLAVVAYLQFLLLWSQAEIGLKQHVLFASQFEPFFKLDYGTSVENDVVLTITNVSNNPVYQMGVGRLLDFQKKPIRPQEWEKSIYINYYQGPRIPSVDIAPGEIARIFILGYTESRFKGSTIEMIYWNKLGEMKSLLISLRSFSAYFTQPPMEEPGVLLNTFQEIRLFFSMLMYDLYSWKRERYVKKRSK